MKTLDKKNIRYNILSMFIYIVGIIIIIKLFFIQIVNGQQYLEKSNSRLTRETTIKAPRGNILDRNGVVLAGTNIKYSLELYKSKITEEELNNTILRTIRVLEKNLDNYNDIFPIGVDPISFNNMSEDEIKKWLEANKFDADLTAEDVLNKYINKYGLQNIDINDARKIIAVRYRYRKKWIYEYETIYYF